MKVTGTFPSFLLHSDLVREWKRVFTLYIQSNTVVFELSNKLPDTLFSEELEGLFSFYPNKDNTLLEDFIQKHYHCSLYSLLHPSRIRYGFKESILPRRRTVIMVEWEKGGRSTTFPWHRGREAWRLWYGERIQDACRGDLKEKWDECRILLGACLWWVQRTESTEANNCTTLWQWKTVQYTQATFLGFLVNSLYFGRVESHKQTVRFVSHIKDALQNRYERKLFAKCPAGLVSLWHHSWWRCSFSSHHFKGE